MSAPAKLKQKRHVLNFAEKEKAICCTDNIECINICPKTFISIIIIFIF